MKKEYKVFIHCGGVVRELRVSAFTTTQALSLAKLSAGETMRLAMIIHRVNISTEIF